MAAVEAGLPMDRDGTAAGRTGPADLFLRNEFPDAEGPDELKVFKHAHSIVLLVALVEIPQPAAGVLGTGEAVFVGMALFLTEFDGAVPTGSGLGGFLAMIAARAAVLFPEMADAERAVHAARRDHSRLDRFQFDQRF